MGNYKGDYIEKMREDIVVPDLIDRKLEEAYGDIRSDRVRMKEGGFDRGRNKNYRKFAVAAACAAVVMSGILCANPVLAQDIPILGNIFGYLQEMRENSEYPDKDKTAYENIGEHAETVEGTGNSAENEIGTITVSDVYCDGYDMYFTFSLQVKDEELKAADYFLPIYKEKDGSFWEDGISKIKIDQKQVWPTELIVFQKAEEGKYVGLCRITSAGKEEIAFTGHMTVSAEISGLSAYKKSDFGNGEKFKEAEGDWTLRFEAKADTSDNRIAEPNAGNNGITVQKVIQTPSNMHVICVVSAELAEKNLAFALSDGSGNRVEKECIGMDVQENGSQILEIECNISQADDFIMQVFDKDVEAEGSDEPLLIAEIPFAVQ